MCVLRARLQAFPMDDKVNYTLVGAFVLVLGALLIAGVLWLSAGLNRHRDMDAYQGVIEESVAGLSVDAPVKYLGVDVGKVDRIGIYPRNPLQVRLHFLVAHGTPITTDSVAVLKTQGLTGIAYVELSGGNVAAPALQADANGAPPLIPFKLSLSTRLENVLTSVMANVDKVSSKLNAVFDADNQAALQSLLADTALVAHSLAGQRQAIADGVANAARTTALTARAGQQLGPTLERIAASAQALERTATSAQAASTLVGRTADASTRTVQQLDNETLPALALLMNDLDQLTARLDRLSAQTTESPNSLVMGKPATQLGPGESAP